MRWARLMGRVSSSRICGWAKLKLDPDNFQLGENIRFTTVKDQAAARDSCLAKVWPTRGDDKLVERLLGSALILSFGAKAYSA